MDTIERKPITDDLKSRSVIDDGGGLERPRIFPVADPHHVKYGILIETPKEEA